MKLVRIDRAQDLSCWGCRKPTPRAHRWDFCGGDLLARFASSLALCFARARSVQQERQHRSGLDAAIHARFRRSQSWEDLEDLATQKGTSKRSTSTMERKKTKESCSTFGFKVYESTFLMPDVSLKMSWWSRSISVWWAGCNFGHEIISIMHSGPNQNLRNLLLFV